MDMEKPDSGNNSDARQAMSETEVEALAKWNSLMKRVAEDRDRRAFQQLFVHFGPLIKAFAYKASLPSQAEMFADELVQETMLKVWMKSASFNAELASASTWVFTVARNTRIDLLRKYTRQSSRLVSSEDVPMEALETADLWMEEKDNDVFNLLSQQRSKGMIQASLQTLPDEQAGILRKVYLEDKSHNEVAMELGLPLGTVKSRVRLALQKMKISIDR